MQLGATRSWLLVFCLGCPSGTLRAFADINEVLNAGPLYDAFHLTLSPGRRTEAIGPLYYHQRIDSTRLWASPPVFSYTLDEQADFEEFDFGYPVLTYDRYGEEYRFQIFQLFAFAGGQTYSETNVHRFTLFPFYFQQTSPIPEKNYYALLPLYGTLKNRLFRDEIYFVLWPIYVKTRKGEGTADYANEEPLAGSVRQFLKPRRGAMTTYNFIYPLFHLRYGDDLRGWQFWPVVGYERKGITTRTNIWGEDETVPGHKKMFVLWPIYFQQRLGIGTDNPEWHQAILPLYSLLRSPQRDSTTYFWPFGVTHTEDRAKKYDEWGAPWPMIVFTRGEGKTTSRVWPFFSQSHNDTLESDFYMWPIYKYNRATSAPLDRERTRILFFLYSDVTERNTETGAAGHRRDLWPLFTFRKDLNGNKRWQVLSILEPLLPGNRAIERDYSPLWSIWRYEKNPRTGARGQSLFWNLYRRDVTPTTKKCSLLFGLFQYHSTAEGKRWRLFYIPIAKSGHRAEPANP